MMLRSRILPAIVLLQVLHPAGQALFQQSPALQTGPQRNLAVFFEKLRSGKTVTVAYFGGSITVGAGASDRERASWRALLTQRLRARYPHATVNELNASVSGTGSPYGAMRARRDVMAHKPDLVLLEFAAVDLYESENAVLESLEGIIRQLLLQPQPPEILLVCLPAANGKSRADLHARVAAHYRLPLVNLTADVLKYIEREEIEHESFWKDALHPLDTGHRLYAELIAGYLQEQEKQPAPLRLFDLPVFLTPEALTYGEIKPFAELATGEAWKSEKSSDPHLPARLMTSDRIGAELETTFEGSAVGILYLAGPDSGIVECFIDGRPAPAPLARIDGYARKPHLQTRIITSGLSPGQHKLRIVISRERNAKSSGHQFRLGSLLAGEQRAEKL